jgi:hypothetical protein
MTSREINDYTDEELTNVQNDLVHWLLEITEAHCKLVRIPPRLAGMAFLEASVYLAKDEHSNEEVKADMIEALDIILQGRKVVGSGPTAVVIDGPKDLQRVLDSARSGNPLAVKVLDTIRDQAKRGIPEALFIQQHLDRLVEKSPSGKTNGNPDV